MKRFFRKAAIWLARIAVVFIVLLILFYAEENWRSARDWAACQKELAAKGETLDLRQLAPPGKPEDDLSRVPLFTKAYQENPGRYVGLISAPPPPRQLSRLDINLGSEKSYESPRPANYVAGQATDLAAWQKFYRSLPEAHLPEQGGTPAQDVLAALSQFDSQIDEIEASVSRPNAFWSIDFDRPFLTPIEGKAFMVTLSRVLSLRAIAHLDNGEAGLAEQDYLASLNLCPPLAKGCFLVNYLIIGAVRSNSDAILWEGLHRHAWDEAQLSTMETALASPDMLELAESSFRVERAATLQMMKLYQNPDPEFLRLPEIQSDYSITVLLRLSLFRPSGWWDQDRRRFSLGVQKGIDGIDVARSTINDLAFSRQQYEATRAYWRLIYTPISMISGTNFVYSGRLIAKAETYRRLARLACRLEEYRLAHGQYPDSLDALPDLPAHLNQEVLSEQPLRYQRKGDGYLLYSVGWDRIDHGGVPTGPRVEDGETVGNADYDWVWPSP